MSTYYNQLCRAMYAFAAHPRAIILGQAVKYPGTGMTASFGQVASEWPDRLLEMPVAEDMQMGMAIGMSLAGYRPLCVYPRWNFLLLATNQLVLHLDKIPSYSLGGFKPKVLVRVAVGNPDPLDPGPQHLGDFSAAFRGMLRNVRVVQLHEPEDVLNEYDKAMSREESTVLVEYPQWYDKQLSD